MWGLGERDTHPNSMQNLGIRKRKRKKNQVILSTRGRGYHEWVHHFVISYTLKYLYMYLFTNLHIYIHI